jgi:hypothetical protein
MMQEAIRYIDSKPFHIEFELPETPKEAISETSDALFIQEQLELIEKVAEDLRKISKTLSVLPD